MVRISPLVHSGTSILTLVDPALHTPRSLLISSTPKATRTLGMSGSVLVIHSVMTNLAWRMATMPMDKRLALRQPSTLYNLPFGVSLAPALPPGARPLPVWVCELVKKNV